MNDDIVERLRDYHATVLAAPPYYRELTQAAADEIERLRNEIRQYARVRAEYCDAWSKWIDEHDKLPAAEWCRAYADAMPYPNPDGPDVVRMIHARLDSRHRIIADEIERLGELSGEAGRLREERDQARREVCFLRAPSTNVTEKISTEMEEYARSRTWECFDSDGHSDLSNNRQTNPTNLAR